MIWSPTSTEVQRGLSDPQKIIAMCSPRARNAWRRSKAVMSRPANSTSHDGVLEPRVASIESARCALAGGFTDDREDFATAERTTPVVWLARRRRRW